MRTLILLSLLAAIIPHMPLRVREQNPPLGPVLWPVHLHGEPLRRLPLTKDEERFVGEFPGQMARFDAGQFGEVLARAVTKPTRSLHSSADCYRGWGYDVHPLPLRKERDGSLWSCFSAEHSRKLTVCEIIRDQGGRTFSDVSAWYWAASFGTSHGPWIALTIARPT